MRSYEELVEAGKIASEKNRQASRINPALSAACKWELGDLSLEVGKDKLEVYARDIGVKNFATFREYWAVAKAYPPSTRVATLSWTVHRIFKCQPDRAVLVKAPWSDHAAHEEINQRGTGRKSPSAPHKDAMGRKPWSGKSSEARVRQLSEEKRKAQLSKEKREANYPKLAAAQLEFARMCVVLQDIDVQEIGLRDVEVDKVNDIHNDLLELGEWLTRQLKYVQTFMSGHATYEKIEKLRERAQGDGPEAEIAAQMLDKLEAKLLS